MLPLARSAAPAAAAVAAVANFASGASSQQWLQRQRRDIYVKKAHQQRYRSRAAFKLLQMAKRFDLFQPGDVVLDAGAAPGGWTQVLVDLVNSNAARPGEPRGKVVAFDKASMAPIQGAAVLSGADIMVPETRARILNELEDGQRFTCVLSDMAPNATGNKQLDGYRITQLCSMLLFFSCHGDDPLLQFDGKFLCKIWQGRDSDDLQAMLRGIFEEVRFVKPKASRTDSAEGYLLATGRK